MATVLAVREAEQTSRAWSHPDRVGVLGLQPVGLSQGQRLAWSTAVALVQRDDETPQAAARRLALYLSLHAERYGEAPAPMTAAHHLHDHNHSPEQD